jgi:hypothetical protein
MISGYIYHAAIGDDDMNYDPKDCSIQLEDPNLIFSDPTQQSPFMDAEGNFNSSELHERLSDDADTVVNQARQACTCNEETKKQVGKDPTDSWHELVEDICLPCNARGVINAFLDIADRG